MKNTLLLTHIFQAMLGPLASAGTRKTMSNLALRSIRKDLIYIKKIIETGRVKPVIDRCYPLSELADTLRYYGEGHARGMVVITVT